MPDDSTPEDSTPPGDTPDDDTPGDAIPNDPTPEGIDEPEASLLPDDPSEGLRPDIPKAPDTTRNDADPELKKRFWSLVLLFNVALFGTSFGLMLVGFEGRWRLGGAFFLVGLVAFVRGWRGYRRVTDD